MDAGADLPNLSEFRIYLLERGGGNQQDFFPTTSNKLLTLKANIEISIPAQLGVIALAEQYVHGPIDSDFGGICQC